MEAGHYDMNFPLSVTSIKYLFILFSFIYFKFLKFPHAKIVKGAVLKLLETLDNASADCMFEFGSGQSVATTIAVNPVEFFSYHTVKNIRRMHGKISGNQLPGHVPLFFTGTRKNISHGRIGKSKVVLLTAA